MARTQQDLVIAALNTITSKAFSAVGLEIVANLREDTPRDTSWARANWIGSKGRETEGPGTSTSSPTSGDVARARGLAAAGDAQIVSYDISDGLLYIANNVPYIEALNAGSSRQAGPAFVERAIERGVETGLRSLARGR